MIRLNRMRVVSLSIALTALVLAVSASTGCRRDIAPSAQAGGETQIAGRAVAVPVDGMICQICAGRVKSALKAVHGVQDAEINLERRNAVIQYDDRIVSVDELTRTIADLGYKTGTPAPIASR